MDHRLSLSNCACGAATAAFVTMALMAPAGQAQQSVPAPPLQPGAAQPLNMTIPQVNGTGAISGAITDAATRKPIAGVVVYLGPPSRGPVGQPTQQISDAQGRFVFRDLPASEAYFINATKPGYFDGHAGQTTSTQLGARISVKDGEWVGNVAIIMTRGATMSGTITDEHGDPVVGTYVRAMQQILIAGLPQVVAGAVTTTDDRGAYRISGLRAGRYVIHVPNVQETVPASMTAFDLAGVTPQSAAAMEAAGRPVPAAEPTMVVDASTQLVLGRYLTNPQTPAGRPLVYPSTFYPGARTLSEATAIDLASGEDRSNIDVHVTPLPASRVSGMLQGPPDAIANLMVRLLSAGAEDLGDGSEAANAISDANGRFAFVNVPAGAYTVDARRSVSQFATTDLATPTKSLPRVLGPASGGSSRLVTAAPTGTRITSRSSPGNSAYSGRTRITIEAADISDVAVVLQRGVSLSGRIVREGTPDSVGSGPVLATAEPAHGEPSLGMPANDRSTPGAPADVFRIDGLQPGQYLLRINNPGSVKSITWEGRDYTYTPFDASAGRDFTDVVVTTTTQRIVLAGTVHDAKGATATAAGVLAFPVERAQWSGYGFTPVRIRAVGVDNSGLYRFESLPAGQYFAVAIDESQMSAWQDPKFLESASRTATRVTLDWGGRVTQDLVLTAIK